MKLTTKLTVLGTVLALLAVYTITQGAKDELDKGVVSVTGMWLPSPRDGMVQISVSVGSATKTTQHIYAPFGPQVHKVPRGTRVMIRLRLMGKSPARFLGCLITVDGVETMTTPPQPTGVPPNTEVMCWAVA